MNKYIQLIIISLIFIPAILLAEQEQSLLLKMRNKIVNSNYEIIYVRDDFVNNETFLYRHFSSSKQHQRNAQLLYMDGSPREILQRNDQIGYFQRENTSFSIKGKRIVEALPSVVYGDFSKLSAYYDFIPAGQARISNHSCQVIRIVDKTQTRYSYILWIDEESYLPLRVDLIDTNGGILDHFKIIVYKNYEDINFALDAMNTIQFPPLLPTTVESKKKFSWNVGWLPQGFNPVSHYTHNVNNDIIETILFSDHIFSFSINVSAAGHLLKPSSLQQGTKIVYVANKQDHQIVVIGELPEKTAKQIVDNVTF